MLAANRSMMGLFRRKKEEDKFDYSDETKEVFAERDSFFARMRKEMGESAENPELAKLEQDDRQADAETLVDTGDFDPYVQGTKKPFQCDSCGTRFQRRTGRCEQCGGSVLRAEEISEAAKVPEASSPAAEPQKSQQGDFICVACGKGFHEKWSRSPCCGQEIQPRDSPDTAPETHETFEPSSGAGIDPLAGLLDNEEGEVAIPEEVDDEPEPETVDEEIETAIREVGGGEMTDFGASKGGATGLQKRITRAEAKPKKQRVKRIIKRKKRK